MHVGGKLMMLRITILAIGLATLAGPRAGFADTDYEDAFQALIDSEAREALAAGDYERAWEMFWRLLEIDPNDARALREAGRVALALGKLDYAERALARVSELRDGARDPEIHFLRGEALLALDRRAEGLREFAIAEAEIGDDPTDRREREWLGRMCALRKRLACARRIYRSLLPSDKRSEQHASLMLSIAEAEALAGKWRSAERTARAVLFAQPDHRRAREMLAWALEAQGDVSEEVETRQQLATEWGDHARKVVEYGRALERSYDFSFALEQYREARSLGIADVSADIERLEHRIAPEVAGGFRMHEDPSGAVVGGYAAASLPLSDWFRVAFAGQGDAAEAGLTAPRQRVGSLTGWGALSALRGSLMAAGITGHDRSNGDTGVGGAAVVRTSPAFPVQVHARGELNLPWRESASVIREGGVADTAEVQAYVIGWDHRVIFSAAAQGRRLSLAPLPEMDDVEALQLFGAVGVDLVVAADPARRARGEMLDDDLLSPTGFADAIVLSYRHYELTSDDPFGSRLVLVERSSSDELSAMVRRVVDDDGLFAFELRGGGGYDYLRSAVLWRAGGSLLVSATANSRFAVGYDIASESGTGLDGRRYAGSAMFHVDL
jgi:tetratricopeptide (TPR) repeat protein